MTTLQDQGYTLVKSLKNELLDDGRVVGLRQTNDGELVVSKTFLNASLGPPDEVRLLRLLPPHDNIVNILTELPDSPSPDNFTMILKYYNGGDFGELLGYMMEKGLYLPEHFLWHVLLQVSRALQHCLRNRLVSQGDIHPGNWLIHFHSSIQNSYPDIILIDFEYGNSNSPRAVAKDIGGFGYFFGQAVLNNTPPSSTSLNDDFATLVDQFNAAGNEVFSPRACDKLYSKAIHMAENALAQAEKPFILPQWAIDYFTSNRAEIAQAQQEARTNPLDESAEWKFPDGFSISDHKFIEQMELEYDLANNNTYIYTEQQVDRLRYIRTNVEADHLALLATLRTQPQTGELGDEAQERVGWMERLDKMLTDIQNPDWEEFGEAAGRNTTWLDGAFDDDEVQW